MRRSVCVLYCFLAAFLVVFFSSSANASTISFSDVLSGTLVKSGGDIAIDVPLTKYLSAVGGDGIITGINVSVHGNSPFGGVNEPIAISYTNNPYNLYGFVGKDRYYNRYNSIIENDRAVDTLALSDGVNKAFGSDKCGAAECNKVEGQYFDVGMTSTKNAYGGSNIYIDNENIVTEGYYGDLSADIDLSAYALDVANKTKNIFLVLSALDGYVNLSSISGTITVSPVPIPACGPILIGLILVFWGRGLAKTRSARA